MPDWRDMVKLEPGLLEVEAAATDAALTDLADRRWTIYVRLKRRLVGLVGDGARCPALGENECWEAACRHLDDLLPGDSV